MGELIYLCIPKTTRYRFCGNLILLEGKRKQYNEHEYV